MISDQLVLELWSKLDDLIWKDCHVSRVSAKYLPDHDVESLVQSRYLIDATEVLQYGRWYMCKLIQSCK